MARKSKDWDVRTNLNSTPGSQGTLFSGGTKHMSDERFPRGYTPERKAEISNAMFRVDPEHNTLRDHLYTGGTRADNAPKRNLIDTVSRSTVPVEHLQPKAPTRQLAFWTHHRSGDGTLGDEHEGHAGHYNRAPRGFDGIRHDIVIDPAHTRGSTIIHEIGHHVSNLTDQPHSGVRTPETQGAEESFADNYAQTHFRDRRGKREIVPTYGGGRFAGHIDRPEEFWQSYHAHRDNSLLRADINARNEEYLKDYPEERQHPDGSFDEPLIHKSYVSEDEKKRGVKAEIEGINPEARPY